MKFKTTPILLTTLLILLKTDVFAMDIDGPDLTNWDGKSSIKKWIPKIDEKKPIPAGLTWTPQRGWLLNANPDKPGKFFTNGRDDYPLHLIFISGKFKAVFAAKEKDDGTPINPQDYQFNNKEEDFTVIPNYDKRGVKGSKLEAKKSMPAGKTTFPKSIFQFKGGN